MTVFLLCDFLELTFPTTTWSSTLSPCLVADWLSRWLVAKGKGDELVEVAN